MRSPPNSTGDPLQASPDRHRIEVTFFPTQSAQSMHVKSMTLPELRDVIQKKTAASKSKLPWFKLAVFGDKRTSKNCLRSNANVQAISGCELDYDGGKMTLDEAIAIAEKARLTALLYTSGSHTEEAPRWRILLPTSKALPPTERAKLVERVHGLYGGIFDPASFTLSQAFYYGSVKSNPEHRAVVTDGDFIDLRGDLDNKAIGKNGKLNGKGDKNFFQDYYEIMRGKRPTPLGKIAAALAVVPDDNRDTWITVGHSLKSEYPGDEGLELFKEWSATFEENDEDYTVETWNSFDPHDITIATLFYLADEKSPGWWERAREVKDLQVFDAGDDVTLPPPRAWLLGTSFARKFLSSIFATGGAGKTALRYAQFIALATMRMITGEHVFQRCRVLIISLEDDRDELRRRVEAVLKHHGIDRSEIKGWLFYATPNADCGKLLMMDKHGSPTRGKLATSIESIINTYDIDLVAIDPFIKSHSVEENSNSAIDDVVQVLTDLGAKYNIAIDTPHHVAKGTATPGNADSGRGASSLKDAGRLVYTLTRMSVQEAEAFGVSEEERLLLIRVDSGKVNILRPSASAKWFRLVGIPLNNGNEMYPNGDEVQTVQPWTPPSAWADLDKNLLNRILTAIDAGVPDGNRYTDSRNAGDRAAWQVVISHAPTKTEAQAKMIIKNWMTAGVLLSRSYTNPVTRHPVKGLHLDPEMRPK